MASRTPIDSETTPVSTFRGWMERFAPGCAEEELVRWVVRFALAVNSPVAVAHNGNAALLRMSTRTSAFDADLGDRTVDPMQMVGELDKLVTQGVRYLVLPRVALEQLDGNDALRDCLMQKYRLVVEEPGLCTILAIEDEPWEREGEDGLPLPPPEMVHITAGLFESRDIYKHFQLRGSKSAEELTGLLRDHGVDLARLDTVLDFGSGCGRVIRHWRSITDARLAGSDYNPYLARWCRENLPIATFKVNGIIPSLDFDDEQFDLVYSISVFTHLSEQLQVPWMKEVARVVRPGGHMLLTLHGESRIDQLSSEDRERFRAGEVVVLGDFKPGTSSCAAFHPEQYIRETLAEGLEVVAHIPDGAAISDQDALLLRKPGLPTSRT